MTPERWQQVEEVLQAALDCAPPERAAFLEQACAGDVELQTETTSLISAYDAATDFIEEPAIAQDAHVILGDHSLNHIGREIGPYKIIEHLGSGGMGEVYLAQDARLDRLVALKILPAYFVSDEARLRRFQREARAASALNHPNILTIHEVGELEDLHFIATEFIDGQTIRELIAADDLSLADVLDIVVQVAGALAAAHAAGIVHRDIKPENIMRRGDGIVKVLDFGIVKLLEQSAEMPSSTRSQTEIGAVLGTVGYMSPEQARGLVVDERTDIWSLGVVLYEMLSYRAPFHGVTRMDTMVAILEREPAALSQLTEEPLLQKLWSITERCLRKEVSERYQTVAQLLSDLAEVRERLDRVDESEAQDALDLLRSSPEIEPGEFSGKLAREQTISRAAISGEANRNRRYQFLALGLLLIVAILGLVFLYQKFGAHRNVAGVATAPLVTDKPYMQMTEVEQLQFVDTQEQHISAMMGERSLKLNDEAVRAIKIHVDRYAGREVSVSKNPGDESLNVVYARAMPYVPLIARSFAARKIPIVIGIYLPMIESAYKPCYVNQIGATGLFQFLPSTAKFYGVAREDMCDVEKMAPAAAHYIADRMAELGEDSQTMTLVLLSYNQGPGFVTDTLRQLRDTDNYQRNFWTIYAHRDQLSENFRREAGYVPDFFAAAIVGENPKNFGLSTPALSSLARESAIQR